jgi:hypothetical protein
MTLETDPKKIQRKVYMTFFEDGLWDVVLGLFLLAWGFAISFDLGWLPGVGFIVFFYLALGLKQKITYPRTGYARPAEARKQRSRAVIAGGVIVLLGIMVFLLVVTGRTPQFLRDYFELLFGTMLAIIVGLVGYWWRIVRWYYHAALVFVFAAFNHWLGLSFELSFVIPGGVILLCGLSIFVRFLRKYPGASAEDFNGSQ